MADPADKVAKARRDAGYNRLLQQDRRPDADPSRGGSVGYPEWFRDLELSRAARAGLGRNRLRLQSIGIDCNLCNLCVDQ